MQPFSIVIITYNEQDHLPRLLNSIKSQTLQPTETIVADANSTDRTVEIAMSAGAKVVGGGLPSRGRNLGAAAASTDHLLFFDSDVELTDKRFLEKAWSDFHAQNYDLATADVFPIEGNWWDKFSHEFYNKYVRVCGAKRPHLPGFCVFAKKSLHEKINGFDETIHFAEDHEYAHRAVKSGAKFGFLKDVQVPVSVRRMERDGRLSIAVKYILGELHFLFIGPIKGKKFNYTFGYEKHKRK
ncbi:glycosyltransferase [Candidatus Uhrbacteria bacterium]|jgi:glycosyltransferase involved in cell wall biosynthesis|nr:glycosyltransferase [Candidatus Uhrbacteria bacterium]MBT7717390.1 glycosyltransferase [Candidatus Uhrbacteria bacterium]